MSNPTILYITNCADYFGANKSLVQLLIELKIQSNISAILLVPEDGPLIKVLRKNNIDYIITKYYPCVFENISFNHKIKAIIKYLFNIYTCLKLLKSLKNRNIKIVHTNTSVIDIGTYLSIFLRCKHIWHIREFVAEHYNFSFIFGVKYHLFLLKKAYKVVAISKALALNLSKKSSISNMDIIYNGLPIPNIHIPLIKQNNSNIQIANVGLIHPSKHQEDIIYAFAILVEEYKVRNIRLSFWGETRDNSYFNFLNKIIKEHHLEDYISFKGYVDDVQNDLLSIDIGVLSSQYEAFGRVTIEYMLAGVVPVVSNSGANAEVVIDNETGLIYNLGDSKKLAAKIYSLIENEPERNRLANNARQYAVHNFSSIKNSEKIKSLYFDAGI